MLDMSRAIGRLMEALKSEFEAYSCAHQSFPGEKKTSLAWREVSRSQTNQHWMAEEDGEWSITKTCAPGPLGALLESNIGSWLNSHPQPFSSLSNRIDTILKPQTAPRYDKMAIAYPLSTCNVLPAVTVLKIGIQGSRPLASPLLRPKPQDSKLPPQVPAVINLDTRTLPNHRPRPSEMRHPLPTFLS